MLASWFSSASGLGLSRLVALEPGEALRDVVRQLGELFQGMEDTTKADPTRVTTLATYAAIHVMDTLMTKR